MSNARDGGQSALAGYLYQIVGALGMKAWAHCPDVSSDSDELDALLTLVGSGELHHEYLGQDAVIQQLGIESCDECVLVQFKFSRQVPSPTIDPSELLDIVNALHSAAERASKRDQNVTGYALVSNRRLGPGAKKLRRAAQQGVDDHRLTTRKYRSSILQKLQVIAELHRSEWDEALERFAHRFGAEEREIEEGIDLIISRVVRQTAEQGSACMTRADLIAVFTRCHDARPLTSESVAEHSASGVNDFPVNVPPVPVRRQLLDAISEAISDRRALVVLHGLGGCGKTVALWQWAQELTTSSPLGTGAFTTIRPARDIPRFWIAEVISEWGNLSGNHSRRSEQPERALNRLSMANPGVAPPIMHLGLDGLDEEIGNVEQERIVKKMLRWFWKEDKALRQEDRPPQAILVVTCRDADLVQKWLYLDASGFGFHGEPPWGVEVDIFSSEELLEAAQKTGRRELHDRIKATLQSIGSDRPQSVVSGYEPLALGHLLPSMPTADVQILEALKHPAMWRALLELQSPEVQLRVLDGETRAIRQLAEVFVQRFCRKVMDRGRVADLREDALLCMLCAIARHCRSNGRVRQSLLDWFEPVCGTEILGRPEARTFYSEALSGGMVSEDDPSHWRWCHRLIWDYLAEVDIPWLGT